MEKVIIVSDWKISKHSVNVIRNRTDHRHNKYEERQIKVFFLDIRWCCGKMPRFRPGKGTPKSGKLDPGNLYSINKWPLESRRVIQACPFMSTWVVLLGYGHYIYSSWRLGKGDKDYRNKIERCRDKEPTLQSTRDITSVHEPKHLFQTPELNDRGARGPPGELFAGVFGFVRARFEWHNAVYRKSFVDQLTSWRLASASPREDNAQEFCCLAPICHLHISWFFNLRAISCSVLLKKLGKIYSRPACYTPCHQSI